MISPTYSHTLFLHGFTGAAASWRRVLAASPLSARVMCQELPGHHRDHPVVPGFTANLRRIADGLRGRGQLRLCGYSLGARVALGLLSVAPELVAELVLIGVHPGIVDAAQRTKRRKADSDLAQRIRAHGLEAFVAHWSALPMFETQADLDPAARQDQHAIRTAHDPEGLARSLEEMGLGSMPNYREAIAAADIPITLVVGARDSKFLGIAGELDRPLQVVPNVGHNVPLEAPEELAKLLYPVQ